jgi:hypothetical protein
MDSNADSRQSLDQNTTPVLDTVRELRVVRADAAGLRKS